VKKKYRVVLSAEERSRLNSLIKKGKASAYQIRHAHILLKADEKGPAWGDGPIAEAFNVTVPTVENIRRRFVEQGIEAALTRKEQERPSTEPLFDGEKEARLIALSCSTPPEGYGRWTLRLLADKVVELEIVPKASYETIRRTLKKMSSSRICAGRG
jgi:hypothetical protein